MKQLLPFDIFTEIIPKINNIKDLHNFCAIGPDVKKYCEKHKKKLFINLMKKNIFKNDFYNIFDLLIKENTDKNKLKFKNIKKLLKYYPIGEFNDNPFINEIQSDFLNIFYNKLTNTYIYFNQHLLRNLFILLFFPCDYPILNKFILPHAAQLHVLDNYFESLCTLDDKYKYKYKIIYVYIFHLHNLKKINESLFKKILHDLLKSMFEDILDEWNIEFMNKNITILKNEFNLTQEYLDGIFNNLLIEN